MNKFFLFLLSLLLINFISAGLVSTNNANIIELNINKIYNSDYYFNVSIINNENFPFYNLFLNKENNIDFYASNLSILNPAIGFTLPIFITSNENFNGELRLKGYYNISNINHVPETKEVIINTDGYIVTPCDFSIQSGDSILFKNQGATNVKSNFFDLNSGSSNLQTYTVPQVINYIWSIGLWAFKSCKITVLPNSGLINDPAKDLILKINMSVSYNPTNLSYINLNNNYTINFYSSDEGLFSLTNIGENDARNIQLSGDWLSFNLNNFDLDKGKTKVISYTISPYISETSQTDKNYIKNIVVSGNFNSLNIPLNIFIPYADIGNITTNSTEDLYNMLCSIFPKVCATKVEYRYIPQNNATSYVPITDEQWRDYNLQLELQKQDANVLTNSIKEAIYNFTSGFGLVNERMNNLSNYIQEENIKKGNENNTILIISIISLILVLLGIIGFIGIKKWNKNKQEELERI